jgi:hypothetical protein
MPNPKYTAAGLIVALPSNQQAYKLDSGESFVVEITRADLQPAEAAQWLALLHQGVAGGPDRHTVGRRRRAD